MATENYGLPTFDGENATKPIQFKSTITQGFQKIDEVMKANETAAGPVEGLGTVVQGISENVKALGDAVNSMNTYTSFKPGFTLDNVGTLFDSVYVNPYYNDGIYVVYRVVINIKTNTRISNNSVFAHCEGDPFNIKNATIYLPVLALFRSGTSIQRVETGFRITATYDSSNNQTNLKVNADINPDANTIQLWGELRLRNPVTLNMNVPSAAIDPD